MTKHSAILMALKRKREEKTKTIFMIYQTCPFWHLLSLILIIKNTVKITFPISVKTILSFLVSFEYLANPFSCKQ